VEGQVYSPHNYDEKFEGVITLRRAPSQAHANVPAVKLAEKSGHPQRCGTWPSASASPTPLPPYLPLALGAADMRLIEHVLRLPPFFSERRHSH